MDSLSFPLNYTGIDVCRTLGITVFVFYLLMGSLMLRDPLIFVDLVFDVPLVRFFLSKSTFSYFGSLFKFNFPLSFLQSLYSGILRSRFFSSFSLMPPFPFVQVYVEDVLVPPFFPHYEHSSLYVCNGRYLSPLPLVYSLSSLALAVFFFLPAFEPPASPLCILDIMSNS